MLVAPINQGRCPAESAVRKVEAILYARIEAGQFECQSSSEGRGQITLLCDYCHLP